MRVRDGPEAEAHSSGACALLVHLLVEEVADPGDVPPEGQERQGVGHGDAAVEDGGGIGGAAFLHEVLGEDIGGVRDHRYHHQHQEIQEQQGAVHLPEMTEDGVVVHPHHADDEETHDVGGVMGPLFPDSVPEIRAGFFRNL